MVIISHSALPSADVVKMLAERDDGPSVLYLHGGNLPLLANDENEICAVAKRGSYRWKSRNLPGQSCSARCAWWTMKSPLLLAVSRFVLCRRPRLTGSVNVRPPSQTLRR